MRLKAATLFAIISLINPLTVLYHVDDIGQLSKYGDNNLDTSFSLLELFKKKSKRNKKQASSIEESDSNSDLEIESNNQDFVDEEKKKRKKKRNKLSRRLRRIPELLRNLFRRNRNKSNGKHKRNRRRKAEKSTSIEEKSVEQAKKGVRQSETELEPEVGLASDSGSGFGSGSAPGSASASASGSDSASKPKAEAGVSSSQAELPVQNTLESMENLDVSKVFGKASKKTKKNASFVNELKNKLKPKHGSHELIKNLIIEENPDGEKIILEMNHPDFYMYLNQEITSNTGGITPIIKLDELMSTNFDQMYLNLESKNGNVEKTIRDLLQIENENYKKKVGSLFEVYSQDYKKECSFEWMSDLVKMYYNAYIDFKYVEEEYEALLDPGKSTPSERSRNLSKAYYSMKESKSKKRGILMKYLNCFMITFFIIKIDTINVGESQEKCSIQDLIALLYYQNILLGLKNLFSLSFKEKQKEISEFNTMLISGFESLSEEKKNEYALLSRLSEKLFPLYADVILYEKLIQLIDVKLSLCLTYIVNSRQSNKED
ncbi:hypothetical protein CmeUKMEL1_02965 [Cryptosporidium meleagridis]|uniref:Integral membrane protein n=1 Tax=Cryptosporidium meleagridis TaxID=93969 RepID=A0A2P4YXM3_9CRYT|nr:hypothetical protein CmeUKMEL1_02965 [Cryptosporidium meleagridis]